MERIYENVVNAKNTHVHSTQAKGNTIALSQAVTDATRLGTLRNRKAESNAHQSFFARLQLQLSIKRTFNTRSV